MVAPLVRAGDYLQLLVLLSDSNLCQSFTLPCVMPRLQAVVRPLAANFSVKIADFASQTQDNRTIDSRFLVLFHAKKWSQKIIVMQINFYGRLAADISPKN